MEVLSYDSAARMALVLIIVQPLVPFLPSHPATAYYSEKINGMSWPVARSLGEAVHVNSLQVRGHHSMPIYRIQNFSEHHRGFTIARIVPTRHDFEMLGEFQGLGYDNVTPPDVQVAAGPSNILEMVNLEGQVWSKDGIREGPPFSLSDFFGTGSGFISDPKVIYDGPSGRWVASLTDISSSNVLVAASTTGDAAGRFCIYNFTSSGFLIPDQPILGISSDKVSVAVNDFDPYSGQFVYSQFWIINKSQMLDCSPVSFISKTTPDYFSIHPVQNVSLEPTQYMVSTSQNSTRPEIDVFSVRGVPPGPVSVSVAREKISSDMEPPGAVQKGTNLDIDTGDTRVQDAKWQDGRLWVAFNDGCIPDGDSTLRSCVHLVSLDTHRFHVMSDFDFGIAGKYLFYPAITEMPENRNLLVVFGYSSHYDYPGIDATVGEFHGREARLESPETVKAGMGPVDLIYGCSLGHLCRYGDYFGASLDPLNHNLVWAAGEFGSGVEDPEGFGMGWSTEIANFTAGQEHRLP